MPLASDNAAYQAISEAFCHPDAGGQHASARRFFSGNVAVNISPPISDLAGAEGFIEESFAPLLRAFEGLYVRPDTQLAGKQ